MNAHVDTASMVIDLKVWKIKTFKHDSTKRTKQNNINYYNDLPEKK
jgi:hypothetical protein